MEDDEVEGMETAMITGTKIKDNIFRSSLQNSISH
jgi:hypothetical protein